jgi:hypothetical protein
MEFACSGFADWRWYKNNAINIMIGTTGLSVDRAGAYAFHSY